jgi:hypothetical protein
MTNDGSNNSEIVEPPHRLCSNVRIDLGCSAPVLDFAVDLARSSSGYFPWRRLDRTSPNSYWRADRKP